MGHDIYLTTDTGEELYYARYAIFNPTSRNKTSVYYIFNAWQFDGGCSGTGDIMKISREKISQLVQIHLKNPLPNQMPYGDHMHGLYMLQIAHNWLEKNPTAKFVQIRFA